MATNKKSLELDLNRMTAIRGALRALDGREAVAGEGPAARVVVVPFKLGTLRHTIARNLGALRPHLDAFEEARNGLIRELTGGGCAIDAAADPKKFSEFSTKVSEMAAAKETLELETFPAAALRLDINEITPDAIEALSDLME